MYKVIKRFFDILMSLILLPVIIVITIIIGLAIKIQDKGPVFYVSKRIGKNGKIFNMYKFRSMKVNAPDIRLEDGSTYNSVQDNRVTKIGKFIRKTSIDELPQIFNILKGDMSFVGPRPDSAMWIDNYTDEEKIILTVRPGITGYNQVINRNASNTKEKLKNDIYYVKNKSLFFDIKIAFMTFISVIKSKNIYRNNDNDNDNDNTKS